MRSRSEVGLFFFFSHSDLNLLVDMGPLSHSMTLFYFKSTSLNWCDLTYVSGTFWSKVESFVQGLCGCKTKPKASYLASPQCFTVGIKCLWWFGIFACLFVCQKWHCRWWPCLILKVQRIVLHAMLYLLVVLHVYIYIYIFWENVLFLFTVLCLFSLFLIVLLYK